MAGERHDAIVVGGGNAGMAAALALHDVGKDVLVLEAADRVGGVPHGRVRRA